MLADPKAMWRPQKYLQYTYTPPQSPHTGRQRYHAWVSSVESWRIEWQSSVCGINCKLCPALRIACDFPLAKCIFAFWFPFTAGQQALEALLVASCCFMLSSVAVAHVRCSHSDPSLHSNSTASCRRSKVRGSYGKRKVLGVGNMKFERKRMDFFRKPFKTQMSARGVWPLTLMACCGNPAWLSLAARKAWLCIALGQTQEVPWWIWVPFGWSFWLSFGSFLWFLCSGSFTTCFYYYMLIMLKYVSHVVSKAHLSREGQTIP